MPPKHLPAPAGALPPKRYRPFRRRGSGGVRMPLSGHRRVARTQSFTRSQLPGQLAARISSSSRFEDGSGTSPRRASMIGLQGSGCGPAGLANTRAPRAAGSRFGRPVFTAVERAAVHPKPPGRLRLRDTPTRIVLRPHPGLPSIHPRTASHGVGLRDRATRRAFGARPEVRIRTAANGKFAAATNKRGAVASTTRINEERTATRAGAPVGLTTRPRRPA